MGRPPRSDPAPRRFRRLVDATFLASFALVVLGGVVRVSESGLGCGPAGSGVHGWPLCEGRLLPGGDLQTAIEFSHRLLAGAVALLLVAIVWMAVRRLRERPLTIGSALALALVAVQAGLGGLTVEYGLHSSLVAAHLGTAMLLLAVLIFLSAAARAPGSRFLPGRRWAAGLLASALLLATIVAGGLVAGSERHGVHDHGERAYGAHYACGMEFPTCNGAFLPFGSGAMVDLQLVHRGFMFLAVAALAAFVLLLARRRTTRRLAAAIGAVLVLQVALGALNVWLAESQLLVLAHLTVATLLWSLVVVAALRSALQPRPRGSDGADPVPTRPMDGEPQGRGSLEAIARAAIAGRAPSRSQALALLGGGDDRLLDTVAAAARVRHRFFADRVRLSFLIDVKSGGCPEDCSYCAQRRGSEADILRYPWLDATTIADLAELAALRGARRVCMVSCGRGPSERDVDRVREAIAEIRRRQPQLKICACLGLLAEGQGEQLREAGADTYNHNLNTSEERYGEICSTHGYRDRVQTVQRASRAGLSACSGAIFGLGESDEEVVDTAMALRELRPGSVPVNFLVPFDGTPMAGRWQLTPARCLRILALFRFVFPDVELRLGGGREVHLRSLQPLALQIADSIFIGDYLASEGQPAGADLEMIADAGLVVEGAEDLVPSPRCREELGARRRGAGSERPANA